MQAAERAEKCRFFVPGDLDLWASNSSKRQTKHVFCVNLVQICSAVPEIFHTKTKKPQTDGAKNRTEERTCMAGRFDDIGKLKMFSGQVGACKSLNWEGCKVKGIAWTSYSRELPESNCIALHHLAGIWSSEMKAKYFTCWPFNYHLYKRQSDKQT